MFILFSKDYGPTKVKAKCLLSKNGGTQRIGTVELGQTGDGPVTLKGQINGLKTGDHENSKGSLHAGDLRNIQVGNGKALIEKTDSLISL